MVMTSRKMTTTMMMMMMVDDDDDDDDDDANNMHSSGMGVQSASQTKAQDRSQKLAFRSKMHASAFFKLCSTQGQNQLVQCLITIQLH